MSSPKFIITNATHSDVSSISTLHPRGFHKANAWHRKVFADTPANAKWWEERYSSDIEDSGCCVLVAKEAAPGGQSLNGNDEVLGVLCLRRIGPGGAGAGGKWKSFRRIPDTDQAAYDALIRSTVEWETRLMSSEPHYLLEHFGVDSRYQGQGLGRLFVGRMKDEVQSGGEGLGVFVVANERAAGFYRSVGFVGGDRLDMPGGMVEEVLVWRAEDGGAGQ